jgi:hypothetical protein
LPHRAVDAINGRMPSVSPELLRAALIFAVLLVVVLVVRQALQAWLRRRRVLNRLSNAQRGESRARGLLEARGYAVIGSQSCQSYTLFVDGTEVEVALRADYLVTRDGRRYVAEVKTGAYAPNIRTPATRRQLLEYRVAFDIDGVLLVDAEQQRVHVVRFPFTEPKDPARLSPFGWILLGAGVAALIMARWS